MNPRTASANSRQEEILDHAFELVRKRGLAGVRIRQLAELVGVTEGALYRHFPSKEAILLALADRIERRLLGPIRAVAAREELSVRERLEQILRHHLGMLLETDSLPILLVAEASFSEHEELRQRMRGIVTAYLRILERLVTDIPGRGNLDPPELAVLLMGLPTAFAFRHRLLPDADLEERLAGPVVSAYLDRILAG